ncbi:hypothetical protein ACTZOT_07250, partial [Klebsiella pneumoniae]
MTSENKGYTLALENGRLHQKQEKIFLKPMVLYIPQQAVEAVNDLLSKLPDDREGHCCKVSDEAAFCLIQRPYISKTLLT